MNDITSNEYFPVYLTVHRHNLNIFLLVVFQNVLLKEKIDCQIDHDTDNQQLVYPDHQYLENQYRYLFFHDFESLKRK
jgi:hypothetical protein